MRNLILGLLQIMSAVVLSYAAFTKLTGAADSVDLFASIGMEPAGRIITGVLELAAAILLLIPASAAFGAVLAVGVMCGAVIGHLSIIGVEGPKMMMFMMALGLLIMNTSIVYLRRSEVPVVKQMFAREENH